MSFSPSSPSTGPWAAAGKTALILVGCKVTSRRLHPLSCLTCFSPGLRRDFLWTARFSFRGPDDLN